MLLKELINSAPLEEMKKEDLKGIYWMLMGHVDTACWTNSRLGDLAAVDKCEQAMAVADAIGGVEGISLHARAGLTLSTTLLHLGANAAAAGAACSSLGAARGAGNRTLLVHALAICGTVAEAAPGEMVRAERVSREQEGRTGSPSHGGLDLSQEGRISLPTTAAALTRLSLAYHEAGVAVCDAALAAAGGRGSPAAADETRVPSLTKEAEARGCLGACLSNLGVQDRGSDLLRQAVALLRQTRSKHGFDPQRLANWLCNLSSSLVGSGHDGMVEATACMREALKLSEATDDVALKQYVLRNLTNMTGYSGHEFVGPAEAEVLRSRLNALYVQMGRVPDTACSICMEPLAPLEQPAGETLHDGDHGAAEGETDLSVRVLGCGHQFHSACLFTWWETSETAAASCPTCRKT